MLSLILGLVGCHKGYHASVDSRFRTIQEMVETNLPENTSRARVELFLHSRGYEYETLPSANAIKAVIRHVDTETLQPVTARVTLSFDSQDRLSTYEITAGPVGP